MRIVLYIYHFPRFSETFIVRHFLHLVKNGIDVYVIAHRTDELPLFPELHPYKDRIRYLYPSRPKLKAFFNLLVTLIRSTILHPVLMFKYFKVTIPLLGLVNSFKKFYLEFPIFDIKPDIVHFEYLTLARDHIHLKKVFGFKAVTSFRGHDVIYTGIEDKNFYSNTFIQLDSVHTIGNYLVDYAKKFRNFQNNVHVRKIPPAVSCELLELEKRYSGSDGINEPVKILTVGRLHWTKGYEYVLKALSILKERGLKFEYHIVGDGPLREMIIYLSHVLNIKKNVIIHGKLSFSETIPLYLSSDIFVIGTLWGSLREGFSNAVLEAQALGLPVVAGEYPENVKFVQQNKIALPVERRNPEDIANKLELLIKNPSLRKEIGLNARKFVKEGFTLDKQAEEFLKLYKEVLQDEKD